jgi:hypothetical protein
MVRAHWVAGQVFLRTVTRGQFILRNALAGVPNLCWAIAPLIIFKSIAKE